MMNVLSSSRQSGESETTLRCEEHHLAFLELKCASASHDVYTDDLDGLHQGLDRVMTTTSLAAFISKLVVFVMTGVRCYILVFKREINDGKDLMTETMSLDRVSFETLRALWAQLSRYGTDHPDCHLTLVFSLKIANFLVTDW
jgi:hypothetical protein